MGNLALGKPQNHYAELLIICYLKLTSPGVVPHYQVFLIFWPKIWEPPLLSLSLTFHFQSIRKSFWFCFQNILRCDHFSSLPLSLVKVTIISSLDYSNKLLTGLLVSPLMSCVAASVCKMTLMRALFSYKPFKPCVNSHHTEWKTKSRHVCLTLHNLFPHTYATTLPPRRVFDIHGQWLPVSLTLFQPYWPHHGLNMPGMFCVLPQGLDSGWSLCWMHFLLIPGNVNSVYLLHVCSKVTFSMYLVPSSWTLNSLCPALFFSYQTFVIL